ncbi:MAG TPA: hypothetical protein VIG40_06850 [Tissierellaceae bacterium]
MSDQSSLYYIIAAAMISVGFLMTTDFFDLTVSQMNAINLGAAYTTLSTAIMGVVAFKKLNFLIDWFVKLNLFAGVILVFLGLIMNGFEQDLKFIKILEGFDTNPLVLACLGLTIGSIVLLDNYNKKVASQRELELEKKIIKLEATNKQLETGVRKAREKLEEWEKKDK